MKFFLLSRAMMIQKIKDMIGRWRGKKKPSPPPRSPLSLKRLDFEVKVKRAHPPHKDEEDSDSDKAAPFLPVIPYMGRKKDR